MHTLKLAALALTFLIGMPAQAALFTLYDDSLNNLPGSQSWLFSASDGILSGGSAAETSNANGVSLTTDSAVSAGYSNYLPIINQPLNAAFPQLDAGAGFTLSFELQVTDETHNNNNRAGFSVLLLDDAAEGVEIGFWQDQVWAQEVGFTHAEQRLFDTTLAEVAFDVNIFNGGYSLWADGTQLLAGNLRSYGSPSVPYGLANYLFLGDDTSSAAASVLLGDVILETDTGSLSANVPTPSSLALLLFGLLGWFHKPARVSADAA